MTLFKKIFLASTFVFVTSSAFAQQNTNYNTMSCKIIDQDGSLDGWYCRNSPGKIRCYADIEIDNGVKTRVWGGCGESYSDCWWNGSSRVDACE
jgi:hypothetical protein